MAELETFQVDTIVIGAGVVGLATARALARTGREVIVLEAGPAFGEGISSRNSEVIHAGIYYPERSLKAELCVRGRALLYDYCHSRGVGHRKTGKWIVATREDQLPALRNIRLQAARNGVELAFHDAASARAALPEIRVCGALHSPETGIVDSHGLMTVLTADLEAAGGQLVTRSPVDAACSKAGGHWLTVGGHMPCQIRAATVVNAAGLGAVPLAQSWQGLSASRVPVQRMARGVYFAYSGRQPFSSLIYPLPDSGGLGVHLTLDMAGQARFGPDVEWIEEEDYSVDPARIGAFAEAIRQWWPGLEIGRLQPAYAGIRPKLSGPGEAFADFRIDGPEFHGVAGLVNLFGIESPGLTSCLAIAEHVVRKL